MGSSTEMEAEIMKFLCANQGAVNTDDLVHNMRVLDDTSVTDTVRNKSKFVISRRTGPSKVVAKTPLTLCRVKACEASCRRLHLCVNFLFSGTCRFRNRCSFSHQLDSDHNATILKNHQLEMLTRTELCTLLLQNDNWLLPAICHDYNNGDGVSGQCTEGEDCKRMHVCEKILIGHCDCPRNHDFTAPQPIQSLKSKFVPSHLFPSLKVIYMNRECLKFNQNQPAVRGRGGHRGRGRGRRGNQGNPRTQQRADSTGDLLDALGFSSLLRDDPFDGGWETLSTGDINDTDLDRDISSTKKRGGCGRSRGTGKHLSSQNNLSSFDTPINSGVTGDVATSTRQRKQPSRDKTEICMYFIKGYCKHEDRCVNAHDKMPYRWQVLEGDQWTGMAENEAIEKDYCDPSMSHSSTSNVVFFDTMTCDGKTVRRLSTINSVLQPYFIHTTEWLWYWEDEYERWNQYASTDNPHKPSNITSNELEEKFQENMKDEVDFTASSQSYSLSFADMIQTNKKYGTKRLVRRRPCFVSAEDAKAKKHRRPLGISAVPRHWDKSQILEKGYKRVPLQPSSEEYKEIESLFCGTMRGFNVAKIERIQNKALWEVFQWQKNQMKNSYERKLFHGTDPKHVDAICLSNFDWRVCGTHGTAYGQGSYFARDAKYSHNYTGDSAVRFMFVSRVLVGDFTTGSSHYRRPPSKDGGDVNLYDSCVDQTFNPSIFVVFEKHQIYPEYLLQYRTFDSPRQSVRNTTPAPTLLFSPPVPPTRPSTQRSTHSYNTVPNVSHFPSAQKSSRVKDQADTCVIV